MPRRILAFAVLSLLFPSLTALATETIRVATYNIEHVGSGTQYTALKAVVDRMGADVLLLQEVVASDFSNLDQLASDHGYPYYVISDVSGTLSGGLRNAILSKYPILSSTSWSAAMASGDPLANDITRDILEVVIDVPEVGEPVALFTVHLKAGSGSLNRFRRAIELIRVSQAIENYTAANPDALVIFGGDVNDDLGDGGFGDVFDNLPGGLPPSYVLGDDIIFPIVYDPFVFIQGMSGLQLSPVDATHEDSSDDATRPSSGRRLDYVFIPSAISPLGDEVYASPADNGIDDAPIGQFLYKQGSPLPPNTSEDASDHYSVMADALLESDAGSRFGMGSPADHLLVPRAGIKGDATLGDTSFGLRALYAKPNTPALLVLGPTSIPSGFDLCPYVCGAFLYVGVADAFGLFPAVTDANGRAFFPLPLSTNPALDGLTLHSQWFIEDTGSENSVGAMSDAYSVTIQP